MRSLILSSRYPWPAYSGDRLRASLWASALARLGEVTIVAPPGETPPPAGIRVVEAQPSGTRFAGALLRGATSGLPLHSTIAARFDWASAIARASESGPFDTTVVLLSRFDPWVRTHLGEGRKILDAVDSLRRSMQERSREAFVAMRPLWWYEERRTAALERNAADAYDAVTVVNEADLPEFGRNAVLLGPGVPILPLDVNRARPYDFGFWGRLAYFANQDATRVLLERIWPRIRAKRPEATLLIAGADAPPAVLRAHGREGVTVLSPVDDMQALVRSVRVAIFPIAFGTGTSSKILEAAEAGCAIASTPLGLRGLDDIAAHAVSATDPGELARAALSLIEAPSNARALASASRGIVETKYSRETVLERMGAIATGRKVSR